MKYSDNRFPADVEIKADVFPAIQAGFREFEQRFGKKHALNDYEISVNRYEDKEGYWAVSFLPPADENDLVYGIPHDEASEEWDGGPGVTFFFSLEGCKLLKTIFMK